MAAATSKLLNIGKNPSLHNLIYRNLLRSPAVSTPISQILNPTLASQIPILFNREVPNSKINAAQASAEVLKMVNPHLGVSYGMVGLPGIDQSGRILKYHNNRKHPVSDDDGGDGDGDGDGDDDDFDNLDYDGDDLVDDFDDGMDASERYPDSDLGP